MAKLLSNEKLMTKGGEKSTRQYCRLPKGLFEEDNYRKMSLHAKVLYSFMIDRKSLSQTNRWEENGRVFIIFSQDKICDLLGCKKDKAQKTVRELENAGLIERKIIGRNKPNYYYVSDISSVISQEKTDLSTEKSTENSDLSTNNPDLSTKESKLSSEKSFLSSETVLSQEETVLSQGKSVLSLTEVGKNAPNKTEINNTELNYTDINHSICEYEPSGVEKEIKENIEYEILTVSHKEDILKIDEYISIMVEEICNQRQIVHIGKDCLPREILRKRFFDFNYLTIEYVLDSIKKSRAKIGSTRSYLLCVLFNAPATMENHYTLEVNYDLHGVKK